MTTMVRAATEADRDGTVLGVTRFLCEEGVVRSLYVSSEAQGLGLGMRLLDAAFETMRSHGAASVSLWMFAANAPSIAFYRERGWLPDGQPRTQEEFGEPELHLTRDVEGAS